MAAPDLKELFQRLRSGDHTAFTEIYQSLKQPVYTICRRIVQIQETAEDLTQDVFLKLYQFPPDPSVKNVRAYVFQIARNAAIDALRKQHDVPLEEYVLPGSTKELDNLEVSMDIEAAMTSLSEKDREILALHLNADLTFREIGQIMELSLPAVYRQYQKAIKTLQERLNGGAV